MPITKYLALNSGSLEVKILSGHRCREEARTVDTGTQQGEVDLLQLDRLQTANWIWAGPLDREET
jgi:hypothetical protein